MVQWRLAIVVRLSEMESETLSAIARKSYTKNKYIKLAVFRFHCAAYGSSRGGHPSVLNYYSGSGRRLSVYVKYFLGFPAVRLIFAGQLCIGSCVKKGIKPIAVHPFQYDVACVYLNTLDDCEMINCVLVNYRMWVGCRTEWQERKTTQSLCLESSTHITSFPHLTILYLSTALHIVLCGTQIIL